MLLHNVLQCNKSEYVQQILSHLYIDKKINNNNIITNDEIEFNTIISSYANEKVRT